jgi:hypothetical protein
MINEGPSRWWGIEVKGTEPCRSEGEGVVGKTDGCVCTSFVIPKATQEPLQPLLLDSDVGGSHFRCKMNPSLKYLYSANSHSPLKLETHLNIFLKKIFGISPIFIFLKMLLNIQCVRIRNSAVGIMTGYRLDDQEVGVRVPVRSRIFST